MRSERVQLWNITYHIMRDAKYGHNLFRRQKVMSLHDIMS